MVLPRIVFPPDVVSRELASRILGRAADRLLEVIAAAEQEHHAARSYRQRKGYFANVRM